jgi:hypothetical protein
VAALHQLLRALLRSYSGIFRPGLEQFVLLADKLAAAVLVQLAAGAAGGGAGAAQQRQRQLSELLQAGSLVLAAFRDMAAAHPAPKKVRGRAGTPGARPPEAALWRGTPALAAGHRGACS